MDDQRFDELSRALASGASRRSVLRAVAAVVTGSVIGVVPAPMIPTARAAATCQGQPYDPTVQCCTPSGVQSQSPIVDLAACPERAANPNNLPASNGCGSGPLGGLVPNSFWNADFTSSCDAHDVCYETCNAPKATCDQNFLLDLQASCEAAYPPGGDRRDQNLRRACFRRATHYFRAVSELRRGQIAYDDAQKEACLCCAPQCSECGPCDDCVDGVCQSRCDACEQCEEGDCVLLCDLYACEICDGAGGCDSVCDTRSCLSCDGQGACVSFCPAGARCVEGVCESECDPPCDSFQCQVCQDATCVSTCNPSQCEICDGTGACVSACAIGESCDGGSCVPVCNPPCDASRCQVCGSGGVCVSACATSEYCSNGQCYLTVGTCTDGMQNSFESDIDCGGSNCERCGPGKRCAHNSHCQSFNCNGGVCDEVVCPPDFPQNCFGTHCASEGFVCCEDGNSSCQPGTFCNPHRHRFEAGHCCFEINRCGADNCCSPRVDSLPRQGGLCVNGSCCTVGECCNESGCVFFS